MGYSIKNESELLPSQPEEFVQGSRSRGIIGQDSLLRGLSRGTGLSVRIGLSGWQGSGKTKIAREIAFAKKRELLLVDANQLNSPSDVDAVHGQLGDGILCIANAESLPNDLRDRIREYAWRAPPVRPAPLRAIYLLPYAKEFDGIHSYFRINPYSTQELLRFAHQYAESRSLEVTDAQLNMLLSASEPPLEHLDPRRLNHDYLRSIDPEFLRWQKARQPGVIAKALDSLAATDISVLDEETLRDILATSAELDIPKLVPEVAEHSYEQSLNSESLRSKLMALDGRGFENLICKLLRTLHFEVILARPGKDGGIDITAASSDPINGGKFLFQCKRYQQQTRIGRPVLQEFCGAAHRDKQHPRLVFVTTSSFTREAIDYASQVGIRLVDFEILRTLLSDKLFPKDI